MSLFRRCRVGGLMALAAILMGGCDSSREAEPSFEILRTISTDGFQEPSGIVYHPQRQSLFVVGDEGDIAEVMPDGTVVQRQTLAVSSLEGITVHPTTGLLYVAVEDDDQIMELRPDGLRMLRLFSLNRQFNGSVVARTANRGLEGITFVAQSDHPQGGTFFVTNQGVALGDPGGAPALLELTLPVNANAPLIADIVQVHWLTHEDPAGLFYDAARNRLYVISDQENLLIEFGLDGTRYGAFPLPGDGQEGVTLDEQGRVYIAQDTGGILQLEWTR